MMLRAALPAACVVTEDQPVVSLDAGLVQRLVDAGGGHRTISGALHDAAILAPHLPTAMLFVASKDGISHNPAEFSRIEDIAAAADVLAKVVSAS
jgi:acetylornithine deacetylase/succinyl-diaminopimelate desuccinylase-like protein